MFIFSPKSAESKLMTHFFFFFFNRHAKFNIQSNPQSFPEKLEMIPGRNLSSAFDTEINKTVFVMNKIA